MKLCVRWFDTREKRRVMTNLITAFFFANNTYLHFAHYVLVLIVEVGLLHRELMKIIRLSFFTPGPCWFAEHAHLYVQIIVQSSRLIDYALKALTTDIEQTGIEYVELGHFEEYICIADSRCVDRNILFRVYTDASIHICMYIYIYMVSIFRNRRDS